VIFLGEMGVGKTSIINCFRDQIGEIRPTMNPTSHQKDWLFKDKSVLLNIWDTAGQEAYRSLLPIYMQGAQIVCLVFDISQKDTFIKLDDWIAKIHENPGKAEIIIVANKSDLTQVVSNQELKEYANRFSLPFVLTSAKTKTHISLLLDMISEATQRISPEYQFAIEEQVTEHCC